MHIIWFSIKHLNTYINMGLILNIYITYNIKYPQYIYTVNININVTLTQNIHNKYNDKYPQHELTFI